MNLSKYKIKLEHTSYRFYRTEMLENSCKLISGIHQPKWKGLASPKILFYETRSDGTGEASSELCLKDEYSYIIFLNK